MSSKGAGFTSLSKNLVSRARPFVYNTDIPLEDRRAADGINSFVSGHTSMTALTTFMMAKLLVDYHPDTKYKPLIWTLAAGIPATTGALRYKAGKHFFTDIFAGYAVGALTGYLVPHIHHVIKKKKSQKNYTIDYLGNRIHVSQIRKCQSSF